MAKVEGQGSEQEKSLENEQKKGRNGDSRQRVYAFLVYEDSSLPGWEARLADEHIAALISPWHDRDKNPDNTDKKKHKHVMLMFEGKKSRAQIDKIRERVLGPNYNPALETVGSMRGYARYLLHLDNPEKAQYSRDDIVELGGADFDAIVMLPSDDVKMLGDIMEYIRANNVRYYSDFMLMCRDNNPDWFNMLVSRKSYVVVEFIKSEGFRAKQAEREIITDGGVELLGMIEDRFLERLREKGYKFINPDTGEIGGV